MLGSGFFAGRGKTLESGFKDHQITGAGAIMGLLAF